MDEWMNERMALAPCSVGSGVKGRGWPAGGGGGGRVKVLVLWGSACQLPGSELSGRCQVRGFGDRKQERSMIPLWVGVVVGAWVISSESESALMRCVSFPLLSRNQQKKLGKRSGLFAGSLRLFSVLFCRIPGIPRSSLSGNQTTLSRPQKQRQRLVAFQKSRCRACQGQTQIPPPPSPPVPKTVGIAEQGPDLKFPRAGRDTTTAVPDSATVTPRRLAVAARFS